MFRCFLCKHMSTNIQYLLDHLTEAIHHLRTNDTYKCNQVNCLQIFSNKKSFKKHLITVHIEDIDNEFRIHIP